MVFQNYALYPHMNASKNMGFASRCRAFRRTRSIVAFATPHASSASRTRCRRSRERFRRPAPTRRHGPCHRPQSSGVPHGRASLEPRCEAASRDASGDRADPRDLGVTTVYVTHDQIEAMTMGDRVAVMRNGLLQQVDTPQALYRRPRNLFVAEFIGSPAMNLVLADLVRDEGALWARFGDHRLRARRDGCDAAPGARPLRRASGGGWDPAGGPGGRLGQGRAPARRYYRSCATSGRTWARRSTSTSTSPDSRSLRRRCSRHTSSKLARTPRRGSPPSKRAARGPVAARLDRMSSARERAPLDLSVDVEQLHFFDPETGLSVDAP